MSDDSHTYYFYSDEHFYESGTVSFYLFTKGKPIEVFNELLNGKLKIDKYGKSNILFKNNWDIIYKISDKLPLSHFVDLELIRNEFELELIQVEELRAPEFKNLISSESFQSSIEFHGNEYESIWMKKRIQTILNDYLSNKLTLSVALSEMMEFYSYEYGELDDISNEYLQYLEKYKIPINLNAYIISFIDECDKRWTNISLSLIEKKDNKMTYLNCIITRLFKLNIDFAIVKNQKSNYKTIFRERDDWKNVIIGDVLQDDYYEDTVDIYNSVPYQLEFNEHEFTDLEKIVFTNQKIEYFGSKTSLKYDGVKYCKIKLKDIIKSSRAYCYGDRVNLDFQPTVLDFFNLKKDIRIHMPRISHDFDSSERLSDFYYEVLSPIDHMVYNNYYRNFQIDFFHQYLIVAFGYDRYNDCRNELHLLWRLSNNQDFQIESKMMAIDSELIIKIPERDLRHYFINYSGILRSRAAEEEDLNPDY